MLLKRRPVIKTTPATLIEGDGIGPEILDATIEILDALGAKFEWQRYKAGIQAFEEYGDPLPQAMLDNIRETRLALKAPLGTPIGGGFRSANVRLREEFKLYANVRPAVSYIHDRRRYDNIDIVWATDLDEFFERDLINEVENIYLNDSQIVSIDLPHKIFAYNQYNVFNKNLG